jgi:hypothetical protein
MRIAPWIAPLLVLACTGAPAAVDVPAGARVQPDWLDRWEPPALACPRGEPSTGRDADGSITQACLVGGVADGPYLQWHAHGQKAAEGSFVAGKRDGPWVWWHPDGRIATRGAYAQDVETGEWVWWHPNGKTAQRGGHLDGRRTGTWTQWYDDGQEQTSGNYAVGHKHGPWRSWLPDGTPERIETWENGQLRETTELEGAKRLRREAAAAGRR